MLNGFYDLGKSLPNYDVVSFLCALEQERIRLKEDKVSVTFIPGPRGGFGIDRLWPADVGERVKLRDNVAMPLCQLLPACASCTLASSLEGLTGFGVGKWWGGPSHIAKASAASIRPLRASTKDEETARLRNVVTLTMREAEHWPGRNSNVQEWLKAAEHISKRGYHPLFIMDTCKANYITPVFDCYPQASLDLLTRASVYSSAILNMGVSNGPVWMALMMDVPVAMLRPVDDTHGGTCATSTYFERCGIPRGGQLPGMPNYQRLFWTGDREFEIINAFEQMVSVKQQQAKKELAQ